MKEFRVYIRITSLRLLPWYKELTPSQAYSFYVNPMYQSLIGGWK